MIQDVEFIVDIPAITMELIGNGDLNDFLKSQEQPIGKLVVYLSKWLDWDLRMKWPMQLLFLHINGIIHSKLKDGL